MVGEGLVLGLTEAERDQAGDKRRPCEDIHIVKAHVFNDQGSEDPSQPSDRVSQTEDSGSETRRE